jgi:hypothetical protein
LQCERQSLRGYPMRRQDRDAMRQTAEDSARR